MNREKASGFGAGVHFIFKQMMWSCETQDSAELDVIYYPVGVDVCVYQSILKDFYASSLSLQGHFSIVFVPEDLGVINLGMVVRTPKDNISYYFLF